MSVIIAKMVRKVNGQEIPLFDKLGRAMRRLFTSGKDVCEVCAGPLLNRTNPRQIIKYCSKEHRRLRHVGLQGGKA